VTVQALTPLPREFYAPSAKLVARRLLGHWLVRRTPTGLAGGPIVEAEGYLHDDPACHAFKGVRERNRTMFGPPGRAYVYLIYGFYHCFNAVCQKEGLGEAVLIRAIEAHWEPSWMRTNRSVGKDTHLTSGPGKLCDALDIDRQHDGLDLCDANSSIFIAENPEAVSLRRRLGPIRATPRIGITHAEASQWPLRFCLSRSQYISRRLPKASADLRGD
jgi:DNA-3-methyladenine glycosylase